MNESEKYYGAVKILKILKEESETLLGLTYITYIKYIHLFTYILFSHLPIIIFRNIPKKDLRKFPQKISEYFFLESSYLDKY